MDLRGTFWIQTTALYVCVPSVSLRTTFVSGLRARLGDSGHLITLMLHLQAWFSPTRSHSRCWRVRVDTSFRTSFNPLQGYLFLLMFPVPELLYWPGTQGGPRAGPPLCTHSAAPSVNPACCFHQGPQASVSGLTSSLVSQRPKQDLTMASI